MDRREAALRAIAVGNLFHATSPNGASLNCLALDVSEIAISARCITSRDMYEFNRTTGVADKNVNGKRVPCTIDSVAPLPPAMREILLELDRVYANPGDDGHRLSEAERRALVFAARYFPANPLPLPWSAMGIARSFAGDGDPDDYDSLTSAQKVELILVSYLIPQNRT